MLTPKGLAATSNEIVPSMVEYNLHVVAEYLDYLRWLADQDTGLKLTIGDVWELYHEGVIECRAWSEVCEDIGLPVREDW